MKYTRLTASAAALAILIGNATAIPSSSAEEMPAITMKQAVSDSTRIPSGALYTITNQKSGLLLTADADGNVCQRNATDADTQKWRIVVQNDGYCKIISAADRHKVLTVDDVNTPNGANISIADDNGSDAQLFQIHTEGNDFYISTKCSDGASAIDIKGKSNSDGANVHQYKYQGNGNQIFKIVPVDNTYTWLKADFDHDDAWTVFDLCLLKHGLVNGFDDIAAGIADLNNDGSAGVADAVMLQNYLLGKDVEFETIYYTTPYTEPEPITEPPTEPPTEPVQTENGRLMEYLDRGTVAVSTGKQVFVSWRSLATDPSGAAFNVYRTTDGEAVKLNDKPLTGGTNFTDTTADLGKANTYSVKMVIDGKEVETDGSYTVGANALANAIEIPIKAGSVIHFVWTGDFDGDGKYDFLVDRPTDNHQQLEAYTSEGKFLWSIDLGYNSENKNNITPGASTIDVGMWDGCTVYDMDCDGYADVCLRIADGVKFGDGKVYEDKSHVNAQTIAVIDGRTGALKAAVPTPKDYIDIGPLACMMEIGYLDGVHPSVVCWMKNRNKDKTFNSMTVAYGYENGQFVERWKYLNDILFDTRSEYKNGYAEAHQIRVADVNYDGKDEVLHMGYCLNGDGSLRWHNDDIVHGDRWFVGSFCNENNGKEMYCYGVQQKNPYYLLEYYINMNTGEMVWTNYSDGTELIDIGRGNIGDLDPRYPGFEVWSFQGMYNYNGKKVSDTYPYPCIRLWWDGDLLSESYNDGKFEKWNYENQTVGRLLTPWKVTDATGSDRGAPMFYGDILGDWREEVVMTSSTYDKLVIFTTTDPTDTKLYSLCQNPCYRNCMTAHGYYQSHMLDYYLGTDMEMPENPNISIIQK